MQALKHEERILIAVNRAQKIEIDHKFWRNVRSLTPPV
jgi:hypothetical protein